MNPNDQYVMSQVGPMLGQGEQVLFMSNMRRAPGLLMQMLLFGGLLGYLMTKFYFVVLTSRRMILIRTKVGMLSFTGAPNHVNLGVEEWDARSIQKVTISGFANNRSMTFHMPSGSQTLRISPWMKAISGTKDFFDKVPLLINSGQLNGGGQLGPGQQAPQLSAPQGYGPPQMQPQQYGAPPVFAPGTNVVVATPDGNRYPATVVQAQQGQYLCASQFGQNWVPAQFVAPA